MTEDRPSKPRAPRKRSSADAGAEVPAQPRARAKPRIAPAATDAAAAAAPGTAGKRAAPRKTAAATGGAPKAGKPGPAAKSARAAAEGPAAAGQRGPSGGARPPTGASGATATRVPGHQEGKVGAPPGQAPSGTPPRSTARSVSRSASGSARRAAGTTRPASGWRHWRAAADPYLRLCRIDRPIGYLLLLWPTWWGLWAAAGGPPPLGILVVFTLGVVVMRSAGCVINDYADRWLDPQVQRTRGRPLAAGEVAPRQALALFGGLMLAALVLVLFLNALTIKLAVVGAVLAASYPFLKRYTSLPQIYLGVAFGWAIPMAFAAIQGEVPRLAWLLFLANVLWATAYDTLYAMVDRDDDLRAGARSTAILFGDLDLVAIGILQGTFLFAMALVGQRLELGTPMHLALGLGALLVAAQLWRARRRDRAGCFAAFRDNHWLGMVLFLGLAIGLGQTG